MYCRHCGKENKEGQNFCKYCGERLIQTSILEEETGTSTGSAVESEPIEYTPTVLCKACHKENKVGQKFCKFCGSSLTPEENDVDEIISSDESIDEEDYDFQYEDYEESLDELSNRAKKKSRSEKQRKQGGTINRVLITLIISLAVVLAGLVVLLVSFFKTGSFNPLSLFREKAENITEENSEDVIVDDTENAETPVVFEQSDMENKTDETEEKQQKEPNEEDIFDEFLAGNVSAVVADDFLSASDYLEDMISGQAYTISEIRDNIESSDNMSIFSPYNEPEVSYAKLDDHVDTLYALRIAYVQNSEYSNNICYKFVLYGSEGRLELKFAISESFAGTVPSDISGLVSNKGIAVKSSHDIYGSEWTTVYAPNEEFTYKIVYDMESLHASQPHFYEQDESGSYTPIEPLNETMREAAEEYEAAGNVNYYREVINGNSYYYYLGSYDEPITQDTVDYIDAIAASHGFGFDGKAAADAAREAYERELGVYEACQDTTEPEWIEIE